MFVCGGSTGVSQPEGRISTATEALVSPYRWQQGEQAVFCVAFLFLLCAEPPLMLSTAAPARPCDRAGGCERGWNTPDYGWEKQGEHCLFVFLKRRSHLLSAPHAGKYEQWIVTYVFKWHRPTAYAALPCGGVVRMLHLPEPVLLKMFCYLY